MRRHRRFKSHDRCFTGTDACAWLIKHRLAGTEDLPLSRLLLATFTHAMCGMSAQCLFSMAVEGLAAQDYDYDVVHGSLMSQLLWDLFLSLERCHDRVAERRLLQSYSTSHAS